MYNFATFRRIPSINTRCTALKEILVLALVSSPHMRVFPYLHHQGIPSHLDFYLFIFQFPHYLSLIINFPVYEEVLVFGLSMFSDHVLKSYGVLSQYF